MISLRFPDPADMTEEGKISGGWQFHQLAVQNLADPIKREYDRWRNQIGDHDPYVGRKTIGIHDVLRAHFLIADYFYREDQGIGGIGPRSLDLLHSAMFRQFSGYGDRAKWENEIEYCATLFFGLIKNHPFHDANKRTAFLVLLYHLWKVDRFIQVPESELEILTVRVADNTLNLYKRYGAYAKNNEDDREINFLSDYIRRNTRNIDRNYYSVTYRELKHLLNKFDCDIINPHGNYIDIVKYVYKKKLFRKEKVRETIRVGQIGFPNWKEEVGRGAIKTVRNVCQLRARHGVDSESFFHGADPMQSYISRFREPLRRLADR